MQVSLLCLGAVVSFITFYVHTFVGGPIVAKPLLENQTLPKASKWLNYYCWHNTTILLLFIGSAFVYSIFHSDALDLIIFVSLLSAALSALSAAVALKASINPFRFPSTSLFATIAAMGLSACWLV